jgi:hypothetical protein
MEPDSAFAEPEADVFFGSGCPDKATNSHNGFAISRITQNDQIGMLESEWGHEIRNGFACGNSLACGCGGKSGGSPHCG